MAQDAYLVAKRSVLHLVLLLLLLLALVVHELRVLLLVLMELVLIQMVLVRVDSRHRGGHRRAGITLAAGRVVAWVLVLLVAVQRVDHGVVV